MRKPNIKTSEKVAPMIYAYTTPGVVYHDGWTKIGYTERDVDQRIKEQTQTADIKAQKEWQDLAIFADGKTRFTDKKFHSYLAKNDIKRKDPHPDAEGCPEWFYISGDESLATRKRVYEYDISDMLEKPFNTVTIRRRIDKIIKLNQTSNDLQAIINRQTAAISKIDTKRVDILESIMKTIANNIRTSKESIQLQKWVRILALYMEDQYPQYKLNNQL